MQHMQNTHASKIKKLQLEICWNSFPLRKIFSVYSHTLHRCYLSNKNSLSDDDEKDKESKNSKSIIITYFWL